jgi:hypothetical protein
MIGIALIAIMAAGAGGFLIKFLLDRNGGELEITTKEFVVGMALISMVLAPLSGKIGTEMAKKNMLTYQEYWNGWETGVRWEKITCTKDGPCKWEYDCDPYLCNPHPCNCTCTSRDSSGNCTSESCSTCYDTCYHDCPYCSEEWSFFVSSTLQEFVIAENRLPDNPDSKRWDRSERVPRSVVERAGTGIPEFWSDVRSRIGANAPGAVTVTRPYDNYVLASERTILKQYSGAIARLDSLKLLPKIQDRIYDFYNADKAYFVGYRPADPIRWRDALARFNAAFGIELNGDLHLVLTRVPSIDPNPDEYALALKAYWQDSRIFGRRALSKNAVVVIVGVSPENRVLWSRATTGMPLGNELMLATLRDGLKGVLVDPDSLLGNVGGDLRSGRGAVVTTHGAGAIERIVWGMNNPQTRFDRVSMGGNDPKGGGGFAYLEDEMQLTTGQKVWIGVVIFLLSGFVWLAAAFIGPRTWKQRW